MRDSHKRKTCLQREIEVGSPTGGISFAIVAATRMVRQNKVNALTAGQQVDPGLPRARTKDERRSVLRIRDRAWSCRIERIRNDRLIYGESYIWMEICCKTVISIELLEIDAYGLEFLNNAASTYKLERFHFLFEVFIWNVSFLLSKRIARLPKSTVLYVIN